MVRFAFGNAWKFLRYQHPTLGSWLCEYESQGITTWKRTYNPFLTPEQVSLWVQETFQQFTAFDETPHSWFYGQTEYGPSAPGPAYIPTLILVKSTLESELGYHTIFLRCPHDMIDNVGIFMLLQQLFTKAEQIYKTGQGFNYPLPDDNSYLSRRLSPSLPVIANVPESISPTHPLLDLQSYFNKHNESSVGALALNAGLVGGDHIKRIAVTADKEVSDQVFNGFSNGPGIGIRGSHLYTAALAVALSDNQIRFDEPRVVHFFHRPMINLRFSFPPSPDRPASNHPVGLYSVLSTVLKLRLRVPGLRESLKSYPNDVMALANCVQQYETTTKNEVQQLKEKLPGIIPEAMVGPWNFKAPFNPSQEENLLAAPWDHQGQNPSPDFNASQETESPVGPVSLYDFGNMESNFPTNKDFFDIPTVWGASQPIRAGIDVHLSIYKGEIELSAVYNTRFREEETVETFLQGIHRHVFRGLRLEEGLELRTTR
ncbi:hypothetical protein NW752_008240 [Fusarium irregulare]|uniref:Uncharacterized protein n=1 Tax=Fusarium irregulare TaxID=2494466 RepID=A0A9W8PW24_9HYPO|nr:hypothetical protein NW752_008240 [Fusarium irregulare]KAJ4019505.1 hypothetical protein NW766_003239 [Fusarium irregulare]